MLHAHDSAVPDLGGLERAGRLIFIPSGGADIRTWAYRLAGLGCPEFHLLDREEQPHTEVRLQVARAIAERPGCRAFVTEKRALENYLCPAAIREARGIDIQFGDADNVSELAARMIHSLRPEQPAWERLPARTRKRARNRAKRWLNCEAVDRMTPERLADRDPQGEVRRWLEAIDGLVRGSGSPE